MSLQDPNLRYYLYFCGTPVPSYPSTNTDPEDPRHLHSGSSRGRFRRESTSGPVHGQRDPCSRDEGSPVILRTRSSSDPPRVGVSRGPGPTSGRPWSWTTYKVPPFREETTGDGTRTQGRRPLDRRPPHCPSVPPHPLLFGHTNVSTANLYVLSTSTTLLLCHPSDPDLLNSPTET